jgi:peptidylprolyl isomerase
VAPPPEPEISPEQAKKEAEEALAAERMKPPADVKAAPKGAEKSRSGIAWRVVLGPKGPERASDEEKVWAHYTSWTADGEVVYSTWKRGEPSILELDRIVQGFAEAAQMMGPGERRVFWIPERIAWPKSARTSGKAKGDLTVDMEIVKIKKNPPPPDDLKKPPGDAKVTNSGLIWRELQQGKGTKNPGPTSEVTVRYAGWTQDGKCFDSTAPDETMSFGLDGVIPGWTEGLQLMVEGQKTRMWIPEKLAYAGAEGKPAGMLVFDIELLEFSN